MAVNKLTLDHILFYAILDPSCLRRDGATPVRRPAIAPTPSQRSAEAPPSGFTTKLAGYNFISNFLEVLHVDCM
jgi:hypothetical protein